MIYQRVFSRFRRNCFSILLVTLFLLVPLKPAQSTVYSTSELPDPLEDVGHSPRAAAMASAFTASQGTADSIYWNPAGLATIPTFQLSLVHQSWYSGIFRENITAAFPVNDFGSFGLGADYTGFGTLQGYDGNGDPTTSYQPYRYSLSIGWGTQIIPSLAAGWVATSRMDFQSSDDQSLSGYLSAGFLWCPWTPFRVGAFYSFLNSDALAGMGLLKIGGSWSPVLLKDSPTLFLLDFSLPPYGVYSLQGGMEQNLWENFYARAGYQWEWDNNEIPGLRGITAGVGIRLEDWGLDYAFIPYGDLGTSQTLGLTYFFPAPLASPAIPASPLPPKPKTTIAPGAAFKPAESLLPGDKLVNVQVNIQLPQDSGEEPPSPVDPQIKEAISLLVQQVSKNPKDPQGWNNLGNLYWKIGRKDFAAQCFEEILQLQPANQALKDWLDHYKKAHANN